MAQEIEYVDVRPHEPTSFYGQWLLQSSAKHFSPELIAADRLRKLHPGHSLVISEDYRLINLLVLPGVTIHPSDSEEANQVSSVLFAPAPNRIAGEVTGSLVDNIIFGSRKLTWNEHDFIVYIARYQPGNFIKTTYFVLHDGPEQPARDLVLAVHIFSEQLHDEIWVFNQGIWSKDKALWLQIKDSSWDDVVMKEESKMALQKDIYGFFKSEKTYKRLSIPWKRGLIMYGPPGNGKTISIKVVMKTCIERGFTPLYVKSFYSPRGEEASMQTVFLKARQFAPCTLILEDLDSLINDRNRSFFLNQLDGLEGNDGLLVIASTNHFDRLDPGLSNRPSRFDRKYLFDDPDYQERVLYAKYWQEKLKDNDDISFPELLVEEVAELTQGFSFAYLKEAFVSTLVLISNADNDERVTFPVILKRQITALRKELERQAPIQDPSLSTPGAQPEQKLGEQTLPVTQPYWISCGPRQRPLPVDASLAEFIAPDNPHSLPTTQAIWTPPANISGSRPSRNVSGTGSVTSSGRVHPQGHVLHAPLSAYPQVMPGSLPSPRPDRIQDPIYAAQSGTPVANASTSNVPFPLDDPVNRDL